MRCTRCCPGALFQAHLTPCYRQEGKKGLALFHPNLTHSLTPRSPCPGDDSAGDVRHYGVCRTGGGTGRGAGATTSAGTTGYNAGTKSPVGRAGLHSVGRVGWQGDASLRASGPGATPEILIRRRCPRSILPRPARGKRGRSSPRKARSSSPESRPGAGPRAEAPLGLVGERRDRRAQALASRFEARRVQERRDRGGRRLDRARPRGERPAAGGAATAPPGGRSGRPASPTALADAGDDRRRPVDDRGRA